MTTYRVAKIESDPRVAYPAFSLTKLVWKKGINELTGEKFKHLEPSRDVYTVSINEHGPQCSCAHSTFRTNGGYCKHLLAAIKIGLLPSPAEYAAPTDTFDGDIPS